MPIYEYKCPKGHVFEVFQSMSEDPVERCEVCGEEGVQRVFHPVAIHFKGSGFHNTDYGKGRSSSKTSGDEGSSSDSGSADGGSSKESSSEKKSKDSKKPEGSGKSEAKAPAASAGD